MAWDWLKDNNDEPNEFKPIDARGLLDGKEYHDYWTTKLHNGLANVPKSLLGAVESIPAMAARTRPVVMQELENDLDGTGLMDSDADKEALSTIENQTTAPIWEGARLGIKAAKDALPDANWESNVDESQLSYPKKIGGMIVENAPLMALQLAASAANPALGVALVAGSTAGDTYNDLTEKGVDPLAAGQAAWLNAAAQAPLEGVGEMGWLKAFRELGTEGAAKLMGKAFVKEGLTEAVQEFPDETIPYIAEHGSLDGFDWGQLASNAVDAGVVGGIYGGGFAGIGRAINGKAQAPQQETGQDSAGVDNGNGDTPSPSPAMHAMNRLVNELGIDPKAASGIVGGLMLESGGNTTDISPTAKNPKSGAYGIGQWLDSRQDDLMAFAEETGGDPNDLDTQISFLIHELKGSENGALQEILKAQSPDEAGRLADQFYERSEGTDEIRNQKAANAQKIYDIFMNGGADPNVVYNGGKSGGSPVPNPKSAEDFLKDLEETLPADTDEDVEKLNAVRKAIQDKNKKAQEELAAQYGWSVNSPETAQNASEPVTQGNTQSATDNAATGQMTQSVTYPMAIPQGRGNSVSGTKSIKSGGGMYQPSGRVEGGNKSVYTPKKPKGMQYTPQGNVQAGSNEGGMTAVQPNISPVIPAPSSIKEPASNSSTSLPSTEPQIYTPRKVNGIADRQRRDRQTRGNMASVATQDRINKALKNSRLRQVVKQAFVDGDKDALNRLGAMQINQDVLQAVKNDVMNEYHKVEPVVPPKVIPAQEPYTPRYSNRDEAMRLPRERDAENAREDVAIGGGNGVIAPRVAKTPSEAMRLTNAAMEQRADNANRDYDIGKAPSRRAQKKAAIAQRKQEKRDAENTNVRKYEPKPYTSRYDNREDLNRGMRDVYGNKSGDRAHKGQTSGVSSTGKNERAESQNRVDSRDDMSGYVRPGAPSIVATPKDRKSIESDMRNRQQNRNKYESDNSKNGFEKPSIPTKENNHENTEKNQPVHHPEENKNDNAKPEQGKPSESKDRKTPEGKNPVKNAPSKETPSSGKKEEPQKTDQKQDDKVVVRNNAADNDARDAAKSSKEIGAIDPKASGKAKAILKLINKCLIHHRAGNSTSAETIARIRFSLRGKNFTKLPEAVKAKLNEYAERKIKEMQAFDKEHPWAEKEAIENEDAAFDEAKDAIDRIAKMLDNGVMTLDEAIERANKVADELEDTGFSDTGTPVSHAADRVRDYFNQKIGNEPTEAQPKAAQPKVEPTKAGTQDTENTTPKVESKEPSKKGNGVEQDKPVGTTEPSKKGEDAKPKDEIGKDDAAIKDAKKICDDAIREVDAIVDEFAKAVKSNPDSLPDVSNFVEKLKAVLDRAKDETRAIKTNAGETAEKIHKMWLGVNDHILQKADEADKLFADFYSRKSYIPEHDIPMVEEFARKLYKCLNKFTNSSGNMQSFAEAVREMKSLESQINGMTTDKAVRRALEDSYAAHMYHIYRMYFERKTVEPRKSDTEYSMEDVRILAKKKESKKTVEEDEKALALLGQDLYDRAYKPIADYLRIVGDASRGDAFESAVLFAKMMESFHKNYGIWFPIPHLVKAVARRGKTFTILGTFSPNANAFILSKFSNGEVFAHEATHMYESMLRTFSTLINEDVDKYFGGDKKKAREAIEKIRADLKAIDEWTSYSKEHLQEYEGTVLYTEFRKHANAVKRGADIGERTWRTERLARGFTQYLGEGNRAPTKELEGVFARIKQWVLDAYGAIKNLTNGKLPPDMEKFYQSMISGDTEYFKNMANGGKSATVRTDDGKELKISYKIVPAETLIASNTADFGKNENYPEKLQPRDRDRVSMREQVDDMARNLRPEDLAESRSVNQGAPLVNQDNVVENGNGRTMAITRAYTTDGDAYKASSQKYKQYLVEHAEEYGYTREEVEAMQNPVLIRQRDASSDSLQDSIIHSTEGGMKMSASQQAKVDAEKISLKTLSLYDYDGSGDLTKRSNDDFVVSALNEMVDKSERDVVFNKDGTPSKAGIERVKSALAAYAYGDNSLLERISESTDTEDQNIVKAFSAAAPQVAAIKAKLDKGDVSKDYDLPKLLSDVLDFYFKCKNDGKSIKFALNETSLFGDNQSIASIGGKNLARFIADNIRRPKAISDALVRMTKYIDGANEPSDALFSGTKMRLDEIVRTSIGLNASKFIPVSKPNARKYKHTIQPKENTWDSMPATQQKACIKLMDANGGHYDSKTKSFGFTDEKARDAALNVLEAYLSADSKASAKIAIIPTANAEVVPNSRIKSMRLARRKPDRISIHGKTDTLLTGRGWNGSPADFDHFDLAFIGTGEGNTAHGWGIYFARDVTYKGDADWGRKVSEGYKKRYGGADGKLYYAAIPSDNYLLDEQIPLKDQPKHVQESVRRALSYMENLPEDSITEKSMRTIVGRELYGNHAAQASVYKLMHEFLADRPKSSGKWNPSPADLKSAREALDRYSVYTRATDIENGGTPPLNTLEDVEQYIDKLDKEPSQESYEIATRDVLFDMFEAAIDQIKAFSAIPHPEKAKAYNKLLAIQAGADARPLVKHMLDTIDLSDGTDRANLERAFYRYIFDPSTQNISAVEKIISSVLFKDASKNRALTKGDIDELNNITNDLVSEFEYGANKLSTIAQDGILALTGHDVQRLLYEGVAGSGNRQKDVAKILKEAGLKGYKYDGDMDGPCAVVFDNDAMKIINKFSVKTPYQKMVENITPIASDDLTAREKAIVDFAKKMGLQVQFFEGDPNLHGFHADGTNVAFLNRRSAMDLNQTFWHEAFHWMRESNPDLYNQMVKEVFGGEVSEKQLADYAVSIGRTDMSKELAIEEMLADAMWDAGKRGSFFEKLGIEHPSLCAKIIKWIKNLYEDFKAHFHNPQAGLTNTQINRMSNTLSKIAEKLVDGDGNKLFSVDEKGNIKETAAGKRAISDEEKFKVTNNNLSANDRVPIVDLTNVIPIVDANDKVAGHKLIKSLIGKTFSFIGGKGFVAEGDFIAQYEGANPKTGEQLYHGHSRKPDRYNDETRRKVISSLNDILRAGVYIDKHADKAHGTRTKYIEIFVPVRDGSDVYTFQITARERGNAAGKYTIGSALFYNIKKAAASPIKIGSTRVGHLMMTALDTPDNLTVHRADTNGEATASTVTIAEMLNGIKDRNSVPYVVNGKLNYDDNIFLTKNMLSGEPNTRHSVEDLKAQTLSVFPNAQNIETHDDGVSFDLPNGSHVEVNFTDDTISVDRAKAQKDYGGTLTGNEKASGKIEMVDKDALITLTMDSPDETISHEAMHLAWNLLTDKERNALLRTYGSEEGAAEGMREWKIRRKMKQGTIAGKIMQKISDMAHKLLSLFHENDQHVFQKLESGEMWERSNENNTAARNVKYKMNPLNEAEKYLKSHKNLGEKAGVYIDRTFRPDLAKAKANPNISVNKTAKKKGWGVTDTALNNTVRSPSRIKSPKTNYIWGLADTAQRELQELRGRWTHNFAGAIKNLNKEEKARYTDILWEEDMKQHVFSDEELRDAGVSENVIKAHQKTRNLLGKIYNAVNAVYTSERVENFTYKTRKGAEKAQKELAKRPHTFVMHDIRETTKNGETVFQVSIKTRGYKEIHSVMTSEELSALSKDKDVYIKAREQMDDGSFKVSYLAYNKPLTNMEGYMPHIFHGVLIMKKYTDADGNVKSKVVGSADTIEKAVVKADAMQKEEGGEFIIAPKEFSSEGEVENPLLLGDMDYFKLMDNLSKGASLTLDEAREMTHATMKGRHVYYGAKRHRKGAEGFEKNAIWAIQHHIDSSSRYVALDPFKQKAISFFERAFGDYNKDWTGEAAFCKGYIDSVLGKPSRLETLANDFLRLFPWFKNEARPARRMAGNLTGLTGVLKLGASLSSGFVNTLQLFNCVGYVGARKTAVGLKRALHPNAADKKILVASGVSEESGLALDSIGHITAEGTALSKAGNVINSVNNFLMKPFTLAEKTIRKATILAAYYKAIEDGLSKGEAIQYAKDINRKVNFDYSVADAPRIFRALQGTVIGDMALQFQKYGVKEMEVISDFLPILGNTTTKQKLEFFIPYLLVSGIWNAFPFEDALLSLLKLLGFDDPEKEAKRAMMEWAGNNADRKALVNVANYGAGAIVGVDISQRVGLKGVVPETSNIVTGGPLGSTTVQLAKAVLNGDANGAMKAISPAAGNIYGAVAGYNTDSKGRKTVDYDTRDRIVRGLGFRTVKEANATDAQNIVYNYKEQKKNDRAKAKSEYLKDPSSSNRQKLKEMGYSDKEIKALKDDKKSTRVERSQSGLSKEDKKKLKPVFDYVQ